MKTETLTIMIIDLVESTTLVEQASRQQLVEILEDVTVPIRQAVSEYDGQVIKFTGDGYIITFQAASEALYAAAKIVDTFAAQPTLPNGARLEGCRVVLHTSDVILHDNDVIGEGVVTVARLEKHVPTNEIYLTSTVKDVAKSAEFEFELVGDFPLKGLSNPVKVYRLITGPLSGIERGIYLTITDLLGMTQFMTSAPVDLVNKVMQRWIDFQRDALFQVRGRLRAIVGDNLVTTYHSADDAVDALLRLDTLVSTHNDTPGEFPKFSYTSVTCKGDLFVLSIGVNGPLVSRGFRFLEQVDRGQKMIEKSVYDGLTRYRDRFTETPVESQPAYRLIQK